ncbi:unnamed protein product [Angiostrongylus costaricensis]|uniref:Metalloendopeptidase n=1 Tax=Angiostrongylus costaricensis TaxID=334426 RepID=A0A0R3PVY2_ANGCS|nr:unnamed protein product [Angiostrongylus costaricensis]
MNGTEVEKCFNTSLSRPCQKCVVIQIVQHELLHVIGLWHEHMRYDRDKYVRVNYMNIRPGLGSQFDIISSKYSTVFNIPYDYTSVMHYGKTAFARRGTITMQTLDSRYTDVIGRQTDASLSDYQKVCNIYGCGVCNRRRMNSISNTEKTDLWKPNPMPDDSSLGESSCSKHSLYIYNTEPSYSLDEVILLTVTLISWSVPAH